MGCLETIESPAHAYKILLEAAMAIPTWHFVLAVVLFCTVLLYNFLEFHFFEDLLSGFRGSPVLLTYNLYSEIYEKVASECQTLHGRYLATPWLSSPHFQTLFINFNWRAPVFKYRREIFHASDGGTFALDWLMSSDVSEDTVTNSSTISKDDSTPIMVVIPGLTSDSASPYLKHLAYNAAKCGWNVVVSNHRGLGGMSVTSDCFYNAGWTEDIRSVVEYIHQAYPKAPLFLVGTSIGANVLVKYLGEDGENVDVAGAVAICSPWDLLIGSRFIGRRLIQKLYDRALTIGLQGYALLHQSRYSRLANWEGIEKSRSIREFDAHATCIVGNYEVYGLGVVPEPLAAFTSRSMDKGLYHNPRSFSFYRKNALPFLQAGFLQTVDTYYRHCSSATFVGRVSIPLLCISALDDPVCTSEAIPRDECRTNKNIVLAMTKHGGHLAFFEGIAGSSLWWVRATNEFLGVLHSSTLMHKRKTQSVHCHSALEESLIDQGPYLSAADGMVVAMATEPTSNHNVYQSSEEPRVHDQNSEIILDRQQIESTREAKSEPHSTITPTSSKCANSKDVKSACADVITNYLSKLSRQNKMSMWLLAYVAILSTWPLLGIGLKFLFRNKFKKVLPANVHK